ncbi:hypothetical protein [Shimazuella alba]|uniref:Uncharacterized protein n=1 Tax=Shimazuella alba TaxID=2690964 RepID=A0A6I4VPR0_9BACL|nr:hypothetical protein [Shimazuella alba]MXQ52388.1 hypothetical protein [Shimazuella alba]
MIWKNEYLYGLNDQLLYPSPAKPSQSTASLHQQIDNTESVYLVRI